jgi:hypothetical protein
VETSAARTTETDLATPFEIDGVPRNLSANAKWAEVRPIY